MPSKAATSSRSSAASFRYGGGSGRTRGRSGGARSAGKRRSSGRLGGIARWIAGAGAVAFGILAYGYLTLPDVRPLAKTNPTTTAFMALREREAHAKGTPARKVQHWVPYHQIAQPLKRAVLVAEDAAFWDHDGVDYVELEKSIRIDLAQGRMLRGASTITQQLAKNLYLSPSKNPLRKLAELVIARRLEAELTKTRIFELYLNVIEWGDGIYGVDAAAREYFGIPASALNATQAALLAGAIINPRVLTVNHPTPRLKRRQQIILARMGGRTTAPMEEEIRRREPKPAPDQVPLDALDELPPAKPEPPRLPPETETPAPEESVAPTPSVPAPGAEPSATTPPAAGDPTPQ